MRAVHIVRRLCEPCLATVHEARFNAVVRTVEGITEARRVTGAAIGRALRGCKPRHGIKAVNRLLGNPKLARERPDWYRALVAALTRSQRRVVVLVDWTQLRGDYWALVAAVPFQGRSLPIFAKAHEHADVGRREVHEVFLRELLEVVPTRAKLVVVADGGFRSPFFRACHDLGIDFVIRLRNDRATVSFDPPTRVSFGALFRRAQTYARCLGRAAAYASSESSTGVRLVLGPRPEKAARRAAYADDYERKRACEPWLLATTLENETAASIVNIYAKRMQVEECFRDTKNGHLGWALHHAQLRSTDRYDTLLLLVAIAFATVTLIGAAAVERNMERHLRASSVKARRLSFFRTGNLVVETGLIKQLRVRDAWRVLRTLRSIQSSLFPYIKPPTSGGKPLRLPLPHGLFCSDCGWKGRVYGWPK